MEIGSRKYDEFRKDYDSIINSTIPEPGRSEALMRVDTRLAERLILDSGSRVEVASLQEATTMAN